MTDTPFEKWAATKTKNFSGYMTPSQYSLICTGKFWAVEFLKELDKMAKAWQDDFDTDVTSEKEALGQAVESFRSRFCTSKLEIL